MGRERHPRMFMVSEWEIDFVKSTLIVWAKNEREGIFENSAHIDKWQRLNRRNPSNGDGYCFI